VKFALPFLFLFIAIGASSWLKLLADDLNRAAHRRRRRPGTAFEPDVDPAEDDDHAAFSAGLRALRADPNLPKHIRNKLQLYRGLQVAAIASIVATIVTRPCPATPSSRTSTDGVRCG